MEQFVKLLYDRLESKRDLQLQLYVIMQNAINEMHNNGIIASLTGERANAVHDPDPEVRVREKTCLAKTVGKQFIPTTLPAPSENGLSYLAVLHYDPRFVNSITLCFQGGIEGLHLAFAKNEKTKLDKYIITVDANGHDLTAFISNIEKLDQMYDDISIVVLCHEKILYDPTKNKLSEKTSVQKNKEKTKGGFFAKLFKKK